MSRIGKSPAPDDQPPRRERREGLRVDVAMAVCDGETHLDEQLASIAGQLTPPSRLVVRDDCSSDASLTILRRFAAAVDFPVCVLEGTERLGSARSFERALAACDGDVIVLSDQDDRWHPRRLDRLVQVFGVDGRVSLAYCDGRLIDADGAPLRRTIGQAFQSPAVADVPLVNLFLRTLTSPFVPGCTIAVSRSLLASALPFPSELSDAEVGLEHDGWLIGLGWAEGGVVVLDEPLVDYRIHPGQQIGLVGGSGVHARWALPSAEQRRGELRRRLAAAQVLRAGMDRLSPTARTRQCGAQLDALIAHLRARRDLPGRFGARARAVHGLWSTGEYARYSSGIRSVAVDLARQASRP